MAGTMGILQVDAYTGYNAVFVTEGRERVGCLSHARRKFFNALESAPQDATEALDWILSLYEVEYEAAARNIVGTPAHRVLRKGMTAERMESFAAWMAEREPHYPPQSPMGAALRYGQKTLESLRPILTDPRLRLDNNLAENALRLVAIGRKNFLFVGDDETGQNLAVLQTVVATCIAHSVNPELYIAGVLLKLEDTPQTKIDDLLPGNWHPPPQDTTPPASS
jgi:transposase